MRHYFSNYNTLCDGSKLFKRPNLYKYTCRIWVNCKSLYKYSVGLEKLEIPQSHIADQPTAPRGRATEHRQKYKTSVRQQKQNNQLSLPL